MRKAAIILGVLLATGSAARADSITVEKLPYRDVSIIDVRLGKIVFRLPSGRRSITKPVREITFISIGRDGAFNRAESLLKEGKPAQAVKAYDEARRDFPSNSWENRLTEYRLLVALDRGAMIDRAVAEWSALVERDGFRAETMLMQPTRLAPKGSAENARAIDRLEEKLKQAKNQQYANTIRKLLLSLYSREGLADKAKALAEGVTKSPTDDTGLPGRPVPKVQTVRAGDVGVLMGAVEVFLKQGDAASAMRAINGNIRRFDTGTLPGALLVRGQARMMMAEKAEQDESTRLLLQAGLDFMRIVANYPDSIDAGEALYQAGRVNSLLPTPNHAAARKAYQQVVSTYGETEAARKAQRALRQMKDDGAGTDKRRNR